MYNRGQDTQTNVQYIAIKLKRYNIYYLSEKYDKNKCAEVRGSAEDWTRLLKDKKNFNTFEEVVHKIFEERKTYVLNGDEYDQQVVEGPSPRNRDGNIMNDDG